MTIIKCDRCGRKIQGEDNYGTLSMSKRAPYYSAWSARGNLQYDLCTQCYDEIKIVIDNCFLDNTNTQNI